MKRSYIAIFFIVVILLACFVRFSTIKDRFTNFDSAGIAYNASVILNEGVPYRDTAEWKDPASFFLFALFFKIFGKSLIPLRIIANLWILFTCFILYLITRRLSNQKAALFAFFLYGVFSFNSDLGDINYNTWMVLPYVLAMYLFVIAVQEKKIACLLLCGIAGGIAIFFKKQAFIFFPMAFVYILFQHLPIKGNKFKLKPFVVECIMLGLGLFIATIPFIIYFASHDALGSFFTGFVWNKEIVTYSIPEASESWLFLFLNGLKYLFTINPQICIFTIGGFLFLIATKYFSSKEGILVLLWLLFSFIAASIGFRFTFFYFSQLLPAMCLVAAIPFARIPFRWILVTMIALLISTMIWTTHLLYHGNETFLSVVHRRFMDHPYSIQKDQLVAKYIKENTKPDDRIFVWGWHGMGIYFYSERFSPSPVYKQLMVLTTPNTNTGWKKSDPIHIRKSRFGDMLVKDIQHNPPKYFVFTDSLRELSGADRDPIYEFTELMEILEKEYKLDKKIGRFRIYKRHTS